MSRKNKSIKLLNEEMRFIEVHIETLIESDIFTLIKTGQLSVHDFAAWVEHQRDEWFLYGQNSVDNNK